MKKSRTFTTNSLTLLSPPKLLTCSLIFLFFLIRLASPIPAAADEDDEFSLISETKDLWKQYKKHMDGVLDLVIEMDIWGISTPQLPKGIWKLKYQWNHQLATKKYDADGNEVPIFPNLSFPDFLDPSDTPPDVFFIDLQGEKGGGEGAGNTIQISYGITDPLDFYIELPFQTAELLFDVQYSPGDIPSGKFGVYRLLLQGADLRTEEGFWQFIESMGRPRLKTSYKSKGWDMGDIHMGLSWNYYKGKHFAAATTNRIYLPTGYQPDPNNNIELFTGAGFPAGVRAFGYSTTQGFDFRLPEPLDWAVFNCEFTWEYRFKTRRHSPIFPVRTPYFEMLFDQIAADDEEIAALFPDLSEMGDFYHITYGHSFDGEVGVTLNPFKILPIGIKYAAGWAQKPDIDSNCEEFIKSVEYLEIVGKQTQHVLAVGTGISLIPFYIPVNIVFEYRHPLAGTGAFVIEENYQITAELFLAF